MLTTKYGLPIDPRNFQRRFKDRAEKAGAPVVSVHSTRRTCASLLVELDVHPRVATQILRHSQIAVTMDLVEHPRGAHEAGCPAHDRGSEMTGLAQGAAAGGATKPLFRTGKRGFDLGWSQGDSNP